MRIGNRQNYDGQVAQSRNDMLMPLPEQRGICKRGKVPISAVCEMTEIREFRHGTRSDLHVLRGSSAANTRRGTGGFRHILRAFCNSPASRPSPEWPQIEGHCAKRPRSQRRPGMPRKQFRHDVTSIIIGLCRTVVQCLRFFLYNKTKKYVPLLT